MKDKLREEYRALQVAGLKRGAEKPEARVVNRDETGATDSRAEAAKMMKVAPAYITEAERIREAAPAVFESVKAGEMTIPEAKREIAKRASQVHEAPPQPSIEEVVGRLGESDEWHMECMFGHEPSGVCLRMTIASPKE